MQSFPTSTHLTMYKITKLSMLSLCKNDNFHYVHLNCKLPITVDGCITKKKDPTLQKFSKDQYCMCPLPIPLPLTCPAQHLHKLQSSFIYDDEKNSLDNLTTFKQGRLKVLMVEGVIFR